MDAMMLDDFIGLYSPEPLSESALKKQLKMKQREEERLRKAAAKSEADEKHMNPDQYFESRMKFVDARKAAGANPYARKFNVTMSMLEYTKKYSGLDNGVRLENVQVSLMGRIRRKCLASSKLIFYDFHGDGVKVQVVVDARTSELDQVEFSKVHSSVKLLDIVGITGFPGKTKKGELSIFPKSIDIISPCLHLLQKHETGSLDNGTFKKGGQDAREEHSCPTTKNYGSSFVRIVIVGDLHEDWDLELDFKALEFLQPNLLLFTGDFGNENVEIVKGISEINMPKAAILGNHDSWSTCKFSNKVKDGVQLQLECLGRDHVGYAHLDFPELKLSVVGGRPFSIGGDQLFRKKLLTSRYRVHNMEESAHKIHEVAQGTPTEHSIIYLAHNGPTGLGANVDDICGRDWEDGGGDNGDPDLAQAISLVKETSRSPILVVFGHMHKQLTNGGFRKMISVDDDNNIMYLNGAITPRVKCTDSGGSSRAFTVVELSSGQINKVTETWVSVINNKVSLEMEHLLFQAQYSVKLSDIM